MIKIEHIEISLPNWSWWQFGLIIGLIAMMVIIALKSSTTIQGLIDLVKAIKGN